MKRTLNLGSLSRIVERDPNEVKDNEILVIKDKVTDGNIVDIKKRINGELVSIVSDRFTFTINPTPADAKVVINGSTTKSIRAVKSHTVTWSVSKTGFTTQSGKEVITGDTTKNITLVAN